MIYKHLKKVRIVVSVIFFLAIFLLFVDIYNVLPVWYINSVVYLQFFPSLIAFVSEPYNIFSFVIIILILTFLYGRLYCSSICPLGTLMDIITRLRNIIGKKKAFHYSNPSNLLRYSILSITVIFWIFGSLFFINILDPYSIFGRISNNLFRYVVIYINNFIAWIFEIFNIHSIYYFDTNPIEFTVLTISFLYLIIIIFFASFYGRQFCNLICPVGSFMGIVSKYSIFKIKINNNQCTQCGVCEKVCKAYCIDSENKKIDNSRCVSCYNCFEACHENTFHYYNTLKKKIDNKGLDISKRNSVVKIMVALPGLVGLSACSDRLNDLEAEENNQSKNPVIPPGAISIENFTTKCTSCYLCVSNCPSNVIRPTFLAFGVNGIFQPAMDFKNSFCNFDCTVCTEICPSQAILPLSKNSKKTTQIGIAKFIKEICVVETEKTDCGACSEHCPTKAVKMVPYGNLVIPEVEEEICIGCGACEYACPTQPKKSIYVESNTVHLLAEKPKVVKKKILDDEDFPF